jgi:hypothetical protein
MLRSRRAAETTPPTIIGVVATVTKDSSTGPIGLEDGRVIDRPMDGTDLNPGAAIIAGDLYLRGDGWFAHLPPTRGSDCVDPQYRYGWDRGDYVLLDNGLELARIPDFLGDGVATAYPAQQIYNRDLYQGSGSICVTKKGQAEMFVRL